MAQTAPAKSVKDYIRTIVDFPHEGILFRDVSTLFADPRGLRMCVDQLLAPYAGLRVDKVAGLEARGFTLGGAVAHQLCHRLRADPQEGKAARPDHQPVLYAGIWRGGGRGA